MNAKSVYSNLYELDKTAEKIRAKVSEESRYDPYLEETFEQLDKISSLTELIKEEIRELL
jgi:hypothetical protein